MLLSWFPKIHFVKLKKKMSSSDVNGLIYPKTILEAYTFRLAATSDLFLDNGLSEVPES